MRILFTIAAALAGLAAAAGPGLAAGSCPALAGRAYTMELAGAAADFSTGKMVYQHFAWVGRLVLGADGVGVLDGYRRTEGFAAFRHDRVICQDGGTFSQLIIPGAAFWRVVPQPAGEFALMEQISYVGATGLLRPAPKPAGADYDSCAAAEGVFAGTLQGGSTVLGGSGTAEQLTLAGGAGPARWYREVAGVSTPGGVLAARARCTPAGNGGAGRITYRDAAGTVDGSAIVYAYGRGGGFAIVDETTPDDPAAGWLARVP